MASEMSKFKAGFLARTAHELRSPMNSMISGLQLVISDLADDPEEERKFVSQAHSCALKTFKARTFLMISYFKKNILCAYLIVRSL